MEKRQHNMKNSFETRNSKNGGQYNKPQQKEPLLYWLIKGTTTLLVDKFYTVIKTKISVWKIF